jgi:adenylate cyclase
MGRAVSSFSLGELEAARDHTQRGVALYDPVRHAGHAHQYGQDPKSTCLAFGGVTLWLLGYPDQAKRHSDEAVAQAERLGHPTSRGLALYFAAMLRQYCHDAAVVLEYADAITAIATEHRLSLWLANGQVMRGWALAERGDSAAGIAELRPGLAAWSDTGAETHRTYFLGLLAEALGRGGQIEEALSVLAEAISQLGSTGTVFFAAELQRLRGEFLLRRQSTNTTVAEAEGCFRQAIAIAQGQRAKSFELRAATSLVRLHRNGDRPNEARKMLEECYGWFTEGFDTPDLQDARALLAELSG